MARTIARLYTLHEPRVIDSDTIQGWVQVHRDVRLLWRIRLREIEGGEKGTLTGARGTLSLQATLNNTAALGLWLQDDGSHLDKYGRHVTDIVCADGQTITSKLLHAGAHWRRSSSTPIDKDETLNVQPSAEGAGTSPQGG